MDDFAAMRNVLEHLCSERDECDRHFVLAHTKWLVEQNYSRLQTTLRPLLIQKNFITGKTITFNKY